MPLTGLLPSDRSAPLGAFPVRLVAFLQGWSLFLQELVAVLPGSQTTGLKTTWPAEYSNSDYIMTYHWEEEIILIIVRQATRARRKIQ